uniref:Uncharacterized protein n=1 Tax=Noccaea caerulescens TaxID=107243 RepID=A0A1J3IQ10_NOCCA
MLISKVMRLISNNFFPESQKAKFIEILQKNGAELNINSLYELALHDYDLLPIANSILSTPIDRFSGQLLLRLGVAAHKLAFKTGLPEATAQSNAIKEKLAE